MWIWCSDKYIQNHPETVQSIKNASNRPFITDEIPHLLFDLAGIYSKYFKPELSIINENFAEGRERIILVGEDNTEYNYDIVIHK